MKTKVWAITLMFVCTLLTSTAQLLYKKGASTLSFDPTALLNNYYLLTGMAIYVIGAFLMILAFRGGEVTVLYPIIATSYIWVSIISIFFLREVMNVFKWIGIFTIITGIVLVGIGSKNKEEMANVPGVI